MALFGLVSRKEHAAELAQREAAAQEAIEAVRTELSAKLDAVKAESYPNWLLKTADAEKWNIPDPSVYANQATLYQKLSWVLQAVSFVASAGALTPFEVERVVAGGKNKSIFNHAFELLLQHPNDQDSRYEFLYATIAYWKLNGNAYWYLNRKDEFSPPDELWIIPPSMIVPVPDGRMYIKGYAYYPGTGAEMALEPWQVMHFKSFNPFSRFMGLSAIEAIALVAGGDLGMQKWNTELFSKNNARLPGVMTFESFPTDDVWEAMQETARKAAADRNIMMLRGVGQGGVNWLQNAVSHAEMEFLEGRKFNREEIYNTLAPGAFSMLSESANTASSRTGYAAFNALSIYPMHVMMAEKITNGILPTYPGRPLTGHFEDVRIADRDLELKEQEAYSLVHDVNEIREEYYGDEPLDDERGKLFPAQITSSTGATQEQAIAQNADPTTLPVQSADDTQLNQNPVTANNNVDEGAMMAARDELARLERKALKSIGRAVEFTALHLPEYVIVRINAQLPKCTSDIAVKALFNRVSADVYPMSDAALHLEGLKLAIGLMEKVK